MNILFIGPYRQHDGWGLAARDWLYCLGKTEHIVSAAPIYMSHNIDNNISNDILEQEKVRCEKFDVIIQNVLPNFFERHDAYNIGIYYSETKNLQNSTFIENINLLDELWVSSEAELDTLITSGVTIPIVVIPIPFDTDGLDTYKEVAKLEIPNIEDTFNFYMIAENTERKNIEAAVIAYNREFSNDRNVSMIIKTIIHGVSPQQCQEAITQKMIALKSKLRLYKDIRLYTNEILLTGQLTFEQVCSLHQTGDCLLVPSRGEAYCRPALEAIYFGNEVICTDGIHTCSILEDNCTTVNSMETPIFIDQPPAPHIYTGWETWNEIDILDLQKKMRAAVNNKPKNMKEWVRNSFGHVAVARKIEDRLCQLSAT